MQFYYLLPVILIVVGIAYAMWMKKRIANMSPEQAAEQFHNSYAGYYDMQDEEKIVGNWSGVAFLGPKSTAGRLAGDALNSASAAVVGVSTYVPTVQVCLTSFGRILISREYSELGRRGHFKQHMAFDDGAAAVAGADAYPGQDLGSKPKNPSNPAVALEFVQLQGTNGGIYDAWMSPQGVRIGEQGFVSILASLA